MPRFKVNTYPPVWRCIYCGRGRDEVRLGKEHIIPFSFSGPLILPRASCTACSEITRDFELTCARTMFGPFRLAAGVQTRNPAERPSHLGLKFHSGPDSERVEVDIPISDYPIIAACTPALPIANILSGQPSTQVYKTVPQILNIYRDKQVRALNLDGQQFEVLRFVHITPFTRMLAKIGHAFAVAELGIDKFKPLLTPLILGQSLNLPDYVGGTRDMSTYTKTFVGQDGPIQFGIHHHLELLDTPARDGQKYLTCRIEFLNHLLPDYLVVVAKYE